MVIKVRNGTKKSQDSLCKSCMWGLVAEGQSSNELVQICQKSLNNNIFMAFPVYECTGYFRTAQVDLKNMEKIAWILTIKGGRPVGFITPDRFKEENPKDSPSERW